MYKRIPTPVLYAVAGAGLSALTGVGGYFLGVRRGEKRILSALNDINVNGRLDEMFEKIAEDISDRTERLMKGLPTEIEEPDPNQFRLELGDLMNKYGPHHMDYVNFERQAIPLADEILEAPFKTLEPERAVSEVRNIFDNLKKGDDSFFSAEEMLNRTPEKPYVLHVTEFINRESGFDQSTLTYFAKDGVVVDELNEPLEDWVATLGPLKFGHGTNDRNAVYIRNEKLQHEFEVLLSEGSYAEEVMGQEAELKIEDELKHSMNNRRFRRDD